MLQGLAVAFGVVFVAELGDKSQLLAMTLAARYRPLPVLAGIAVATLVLQGLAVTVGTLIGDRLPTRPIQFVAGLAFLGFAIWTLRDVDEVDDEDPGDTPANVDAGEPITDASFSADRSANRSGLLTAGTAFFVSEFGDKTMLATVTLAAQGGALGTWLGASAGMVLADALAVAVGAVAAARLPRRVVRLVAAAMFALFGVAMILAAALDG
jgi:putative Ca2+/H+ antiporter (TMEM165/GDT1 family)